MRVLIDTNIFIYREDYAPIQNNLQELMRIIQGSKVQILIHSLSIEEIKRDKNQQRKKIILSKSGTYPVIKDPPNPQEDQQFLRVVGRSNNFHEFVDNHLIYCVYRDAIDFLITEDKGIHKKSEKLGASHRVFNIEEALQYFKKQFLDIKISSPPALKCVPVYNLKLNDPIFDSLKKEYPQFNQWWKKICRESRKAWVYFRDKDSLGAILIHKTENEAIDSNPPLPAKKRVKISTLKVSYTGYKIGELFIKMSIEFAIKKNTHEIYLTHFTKPQDDLVNLIEEFGFVRVAKKNGEDVFVKKLIPDENLRSPIEIAKKFYPSFCDRKGFRKFIVPILPEYHNRLFIDYQVRQPSLFEFEGKFIIEGNTIKKAYLCRSRIRNISEGDILLFYRSRDEKKLTSIGVIEKVYHEVKSPNKIISYIGKRSVYNRREIVEMAKTPIKVILFRLHFHFKNPLTLDYLLKDSILKGAPRSLVKISHKKYEKIKNKGGIDERFTIN